MIENELFPPIQQQKEKEVVYEIDDEDKSGFIEEDPYIDHPYKLSSHDKAFSRYISGFLKGEQNLGTLSERGFSYEDLQNLTQLKILMGQQYAKFETQFMDMAQVDIAEKTDILQGVPGALLAPLSVQVGRGLADWYILNKKSAVPFNPKIVGEMLSDALERYKRVYEIDIPLYNKVYEAFDSFRANGRNPKEVYLGRDGIYAFLGRRAMYIARRRLMNWRERVNRERHDKSEGKSSVVPPEYFVYSRQFKNYIRDDVKREYLNQHRITKGHDVVYFDTALHGTIPDDIGRIQGFSTDEVDEQTNMLAASKDIRRVLTIPENTPDSVIEAIEDNVKPEDKAYDLFKDPQTGVIRHIAEPSTPEEQFKFRMVQEAIVRHYWYKEYVSEKLVKEQSEELEAVADD